MILLFTLSLINKCTSYLCQNATYKWLWLVEDDKYTHLAMHIGFYKTIL